MKELAGSAGAAVDAAPQTCFELVADIERYPSWNPEVVRDVELLERGADRRPSRVRTEVHVAAGPLARDFELVMDVNYSDRDAVSLSRVPHEPSDAEKFELVWRVAPGPPTRLAIELTATLEIPRLVPLGDAGNRLAQAFVEAAKRELEGSNPNTSASSS